MQTERGQREAKAIGKPGDGFRHFGAMGVAVEQCEQADGRRRERGRKPYPQCDDAAKANHRQRNAGLCQRKRNAEGAQRAARQHHRRECGRQQITALCLRAASQDSPTITIVKMVETGQRMQNAEPQARCDVAGGVSSGVSNAA